MSITAEPAASKPSPEEAAAIVPPPVATTPLDSLRHLSLRGKVVLLCVVVAGLGVWLFYSGRVTTDDAQVDCHITAVAPQVPGYVVKVNVDDNVPVKQGDVLVQIDPREYVAQVHQAAGELAFAEAAASSAGLQIGLTRDTTMQGTAGASAQAESDAAGYQRSQTQLEQTATANLLQAKANVAAKNATNERARADLQRYTPLLGTGDVSKFQYDAVVAAAEVAKSELEAAQQQLTAAQQAVDIAKASAGSAKAQLARAQSQLLEAKAREQEIPISKAAQASALANVEKARAALEQAQLNLSYATIIAPISGQVTQRTVNLGQYVTPGQLLLTLVPLQDVYVTANFKETQLASVRPGQRARIYVDTYGKAVDGIVDSIAGAAGSRQALLPPQNATGNFIKVVQRIPVKILVKPSNDPQIVLRPGMNVEATIYTRGAVR
jgi:membrane fusion protein (multidrug efflux system)